MDKSQNPPTTYGRTALLISVVCLIGWILTGYSSASLFSSIAMFIGIAPIAIIGDVVALVYAVKALRAERDDKAMAFLAMLLAGLILVGTAVISFLLKGLDLKLYH